MALGYSYSDWVTAVAVLLQYDNPALLTNPASATPTTSASFNSYIPRAIEYGEQRIYRELQLLNSNVTDSKAATPNTRQFTLPTSKGVFVVTAQLAAFVGGVRQPPMLPMSKEALEALYPSDTPPTTPSVPTMWAPVDQVSVLVAPPPDTNLTLEVFGTQRPVPLSASNTVTFLTTNLPDLFLAATMVAWSGYQRDYGAQADDPQRALSWEKAYTDLRASANVEELQKEFRSAGWGTRQPSPLATPPQS